MNPSILFVNLNVGSGIEATGDRILSMFSDYPGEVTKYENQNPPCYILEAIADKEPDVIILNEYFPRTLLAAHYYKLTHPDTKIILLNHSWERLSHFPLDIEACPPEHDHQSRDEMVGLNHAMRQSVDVFFNLNHKQPGWKIEPIIAGKDHRDLYHPIPDEYHITRKWSDRPRDFVYWGNLYSEKFDPQFIHDIKGTDIQVDFYGNQKDIDLVRAIRRSPNTKLRGYIPSEQLIDTLNQYRFLVIPHQKGDLFMLVLAESIRCGIIPLILKHRGLRQHWADYADGCHYEYFSMDELIDRILYYLTNKNDRSLIDQLEQFSIQASEKMRRLTSYDTFKGTLWTTIRSLVESGDKTPDSS